MAEKRVTVVWLDTYDQWKVRTMNVPTGDSYHDTKKEAVDAGKAVASRYGALFIKQKKSGRIQNQVDYGM